MMLRNRTVRNLVILVLVAVLLVPMIPAAKAEGTYQNIDFSQAVLASRINQKVSGDCAVVSMATIESYMHGATSKADKEAVYQAVLEKNGDDNYAYWGNVGYLQYNYVDWEVIYQRLVQGVPSIIYRTRGINAVQHWSVVAGYAGSEETLEWEKFIVVDVYLGSGIKDIKTAETWGYGCKIDAMAIRGNGMNIALYPKTLQDWGADFYASISRKDIPGELLGASAAEGVNQLVCGQADASQLQRWRFVRQSDGGYIIENVHSGLVLSIYQERAADGTALYLAQKDDPDYQHWFLYKTDVGYMLQSRGTGKAVTLYPAESGQGAQLHTYSQTAPQILDIHVHSYTTTEVAAACEDRAYTQYQCQCGDHYRVESTTPAPGHHWQLQGVKEADCSNTPMSLYLCEECQQTKEIYEEKNFVDWTETKPENVAEENLEVKTQYRFRDRFSTWVVEEKQLLYVKQWPAAFDTTSDIYTQYNNTPLEKSESETMKVDPVLDEQVGYLYYHWHGPTGFASEKSDAFPEFHAFYSTRSASETDSTGAYYCAGIPECPSCTYAIWYYQIPVYQQTYVLHQKSEGADLWTEWSAWSETEATATNDRQVETKTLYRYATNLGNHRYDDSQDTTCNVCGSKREVEERIETTPMYRLYNPNSGEHFYTGSKEERNILTDAGWIYEGVAWNAPTKSGAPVYRLYNPNNGDHHYTMSEAERDMLVSVGWIYEGVAWNSASASNLPLYRLFNPNADCGSHHYTGSEEERNMLMELGWIYEGIGWYGMLK